MKKPMIQFQHVRDLFVWSLLIIIFAGGCGEKKPIKIGFSGCLTGRLSDMGTAGRDSVILAVEQINQAGGIDGRQIELLIKDDEQDADVTVRVDQELIDEGVVAIIGHITSSMSLAALPVINQAQIVMVSSNASSPDLSGIDDYFFRVCPGNKAQTEYLAEYTFTTKRVKNLAVIYDLSNQAYTEGVYQTFKATFETSGGVIHQVETFVSGEDVSYANLIDTILEANPEGLLISAGAVDTALLCQQLRKSGSTIPVIASGWALTNDLLQYGGAAVDGIIFSHSLDEMSQHERYLAFTTAYQEHFGKAPNPAAVFAYEAAQLLFTVLAETTERKELKQAILTHPEFQGLQGNFTINRYGDVQRQFFIVTVKAGQFVTLE